MPSRLLLAGVERSLALAIQQDPLTARRLAAMQGRVILIRSRAPELSIYVLPDAQGLSLFRHYEGEPDCTLSAPASLLARLAMSSDRQTILKDDQLELSGDTQILVQLQNIFGGLQIDGEAALARWLGPVAAHAIGSMARRSRDWAGESRRSLQQSITEYLTEEGQQLVGRAEADAASAQIHELRLHLDRLDARIQRLLQTDNGSDA